MTELEVKKGQKGSLDKQDLLPLQIRFHHEWSRKHAQNSKNKSKQMSEEQLQCQED